ncbi:MAG: hypothetical protein ACRCZD_09190 [Phycicoccus sp.]
MRAPKEVTRSSAICGNPPTIVGVAKYDAVVGDRMTAMNSTPEMVRAHHVSYSVKIVGEIASAFADTTDRDVLAAAAMGDSLFVHVRLLAEFLTRGNDRDFGPNDFGINWTTPEGPEVSRLGDYWQVASKHVVHFSGSRIAEVHGYGDPSFTVGQSTFEEMARDALTVYAQVLAAYPPVPATEPIPRREMDHQAWHARMLADRSRFVMTEFQDACDRLGLDSELLLLA